MATLTIRKVPDTLYERLRSRASENRRSINSEVIVCIEKVVGTRKRDVEAILARAEALREKTAEYKITDDEIDRAKTEGRL